MLLLNSQITINQKKINILVSYILNVGTSTTTTTTAITTTITTTNTISFTTTTKFPNHYQSNKYKYIGILHTEYIYIHCKKNTVFL